MAAAIWRFDILAAQSKRALKLCDAAIKPTPVSSSWVACFIGQRKRMTMGAMCNNSIRSNLRGKITTLGRSLGKAAESMLPCDPSKQPCIVGWWVPLSTRYCRAPTPREQIKLPCKPSTHFMLCDAIKPTHSSIQQLGCLLHGAEKKKDDGTPLAIQASTKTLRCCYQADSSNEQLGCLFHRAEKTNRRL